MELGDTILIYDNNSSEGYHAHSQIGKRPRQEDRFVMCPKLLGSDRFQFYGVFDGTVGDFASDYVHKAFLPNLINYDRDLFSRGTNVFKDAMLHAYRKTDADLLRLADNHNVCYSASTAVTALLCDNILTVGHLADSRLALGSTHAGLLKGTFLTTDHKPNMPDELDRIVKAGGSLVYLYKGKPFIRGGDFFERQRAGDNPMQLNYSRAFGAKDLKMYGLSGEPDISQITLSNNDKYLILASDGVWDVIDVDHAMSIVNIALIDKLDPSKALVEEALRLQDGTKMVDNATAIVLCL